MGGGYGFERCLSRHAECASRAFSRKAGDETHSLGGGERQQFTNLFGHGVESRAHESVVCGLREQCTEAPLPLRRQLTLRIAACEPASARVQ